MPSFFNDLIKTLQASGQRSREAERTPPPPHEWHIPVIHGGGGFVARMTECPDEHGIGVVRKQTGIFFSSVVGETAGEEAVDIEVQCPPGMFTDPNLSPICFIEYAEGGTPPWIVRDVIDYDPAVSSSGDTEGVSEATLAPHQLEKPPLSCSET